MSLGADFLEGLSKAEYLALGGCGTRGLAYLGLLRCLQTQWVGYKDFYRGLKGAAGTSSGALCALAFLADADVERVTQAGLELGISSVAHEVDVSRLFKGFGLDSGNALQQIIDSSLAAMGLSTAMTFETFHRLTGKEFAVYATDLKRQEKFVFRKSTTPDVSISKALYCSMCVPFLFAPKKFNGSYFVDGGLTHNVPFDAFKESICSTFVMHMTDTDETCVDDLRSFGFAVAACALTSQMPAVREHAALHPAMVHEVGCKVQNDSAVSLNATEGFVRGARSRGYAAALMRVHCDLDAVMRELLVLAVMFVEDEKPPGAPYMCDGQKSP